MSMVPCMTLTQKGCAVCIWNSTGTANSSIFINNSANLGGAIFVSDGFGIIDDSSFTGNVAIALGGAIAMYDGGVEIANSSFISTQQCICIN